MKPLFHSIIFFIFFSGIALADMKNSHNMKLQNDNNKNFSDELSALKNKQPYDLDFEIKRTIFLSQARTFEVEPKYSSRIASSFDMHSQNYRRSLR